MKTKYVCRGLISLYVNCRWGEKEKEPKMDLACFFLN